MVERANKPSAISATPAASVPQPTIEISEDNSKITAKLPSGESVEVLLFGATVISWKNADGSENLWLSEAAKLDGSKPVRGGIPVVFPVFGPPPANHATSSLAQHGFARSSRWEFLGKSSTEADQSSSGKGDNGVKLDFGLSKAGLGDSGKDWPHKFGLVYSVVLNKEGLRTMINVINEGDDAFEFQFLLHTYLRIEDISKTTVTGLLSVPYIDKVLDASTHTQSENELKITGETDRVYKSIPQSTTSVQVGGKPRFDVVRDNLQDTVIWNPWTQKAAGMSDFKPADGFKNMICVEVGAVDGWIKLEARETYEAGQVIKSLL